METTNIGQVVEFLDLTFPPKYQEEYDNSGFLLGDSHEPCRGVLTAVDLTPQVVAEAKSHGCNLIVTHHPFIFGGIKRITNRTEAGRMTIDLICSNIAVYAAHTNLDNMACGVNGILAEKLGLAQCRILTPAARYADPTVGAGMVGTLPNAEETSSFLQRVKSTLGLPVVRCSDLCRSHVRTVALCGGSGSFLIADAIDAGADIFLTADLKYHDFQRAEGRIVLADVGHYESEQFAKELICCAISKNFCNFVCRISEAKGGYVNYI
ncbi:MAG: Nif3-like dinuclear metal center hexameric protein [Bacteroidales bacterium]|nr:Nif3-like dinuclear metal center hexameric protein [Bacteroidales bacterium]